GAAAHLEGKGTAAVGRKLLLSADQKSRLTYLLGTPDENQRSEERRRMAARLRVFIQRITEAADAAKVQMEAGGQAWTAARRDAQAEAAYLQAFEPVVQGSAAFRALVADLLNAVGARVLELLSDDRLVTDPSGWPRYWTYEGGDRKKFLFHVNQLSG